VNPALIMAMISAFGQTGPQRNYSGYGPLVSPLAGVAAETGYAEDGAPRDVGIAYGDPNGGVYTAIAIAAALWQRRVHGGGGQVIDLSMWEAMICTGFEGWMNHALGNPPHRPMGNRDPVHAPHNLYRCTGDDRWVAITVTSEAQWRGLCRALGRPALADDPRYGSPAGRKAGEDTLDDWIGAWCAPRDPWEVTCLLQAEGVAATPSLDVLALVADPHLAARGCLTHHPHPEVGVRTLMGAPWQLARSPNGVGKAAPVLGGDTDAVLETLLGLDAAERARLRGAGVIE
jgi:crotonobetainyl-CoA:carnitine CoA-transferase CaiB-like acyl-CoA transferase